MQAGDAHPQADDGTAGAPPAPSIWEPEAFADGVAPAVLQPEHFDDEPQEVVFVPCQPIHRGDTQADVHLRYTDTDQLALLVYTSLDELVRVFGDNQTWVAIPAHTVPSLVTHAGAEAVFYDTALTEEEPPP